MVDVKFLPIIGALVQHMDEGLIVRDADGEVVFSNPTGDCILGGRKKVQSYHETTVQIGEKVYTQYLYVVDYSHLSACAS